MTDQMQGFGSQQEAGQPSEMLQPEQSELEAPRYVTEQALNETISLLERRFNSMVDKKDDVVKRDVEKKLKALADTYQALGLQVPEHARQRVIDETILSHLDDDAGVAQLPAPPPELVNYVNRRAQKIAEKAGVMLTPQDPEFSLVNQTTPDPDAYLESWERAVTSKANRLKGVPAAQQPTQNIQPSQPPTNPAARVPIAGSGTPGGQDLFAQYKKELEGLRPGSEEVLQIRRKYRNLGLDL